MAKHFKAPNTLVLIFIIMIASAALTWIIPGGHFDRTMMNGREVVVSDSYRSIAHLPQGLGALLVAPIRGFMEAVQIIAFIFIVGGAFNVLQNTGALDAFIKRVVQAQEKYPLIRKMIIPVFMLIFSFFGSLFGMSEEVLPFVLIFVPLAVSLGYDSIVGVAIPFVGAAVGFASAFVNPFTLGIAQGIAELPPLSGMGYRLICWGLYTLVAIVFVQIYAGRIKRKPEKSPVYALDNHWREHLKNSEANFSQRHLSAGHRWILIVFGLSMILLVVGVMLWGWYINEISGLFFGMALLVGIISHLSANEIAVEFVNGAKEFMTVAFIIASARSILIIASDGQIIDTILYNVAQMVRNAHPVFAAQLMFLAQSIINVFIPSGSGQAALMMPIMTPLSDIIGVSRQTAVLAFQMGDGLTNMIIPTSGVTIGVLGLARIPFEKWFIWMLPLMGIFFLMALLLLIPPVLTHWGPM